MNCPRVCRELRWLARFGELGPSSQPHLDHLADCAACRDEVGFDRAMVQQLRIALAERIDGMTPSADAWERILRRTQVPEPATARLRTWSTAIVGRLRMATAMAGTGLALVLAMSMEIVPVTPPPASEPAPATVPSGSGDQQLPAERPRLAPRTDADQQRAEDSIVPEPEGLMAILNAPVVARPEIAPDDAIDVPPMTDIRVSFRSPLSPEPATFENRPVVSAEPVDVARSVQEAGDPS